MKKEEVNFGKNAKFNTSMIPGKSQRFLRTCKLWQLFRFVAINLKMLVVVSKSH